MKQSEKHSRLSAQDQSLIIDYVCGELDQSQLEDVNRRIAEDAVFADAIAQQQSFDQVMPRGSAPIIDSDRQSGVHWSTHRALRKEASKSISLATILANLWQKRISLGTQLASVAVAFIVGFMFAQPNESIEQSIALNSSDSSMLPVNLIRDGDFEITELSLDSLDPQSGAVKLTYSLASQTSLGGNIASPQIQKLLASTMQNDVDDATRLMLIELLKNRTDTSQVRQALSHSLLNDPNPGVRMAAAESLVKISDDSKVRDILRKVLESDVNPGVRIKAFEALTQYSDEKATQKTLKNFSVNDSNIFIRELARKLVAPQDDSNKTNSI